MATWKKVVVESSANNIAQKAATAGTADNITSQGALATLDAVGASQITDNSVGAAELNVLNNGSDGQVLKSDGDGSFSWVAQTSQVTVNTSIANGVTNPVTSDAIFDALATKEGIISAFNRVDAANVGSGVVSNTEFNHLNGVSSAIQTQLSAKANKAGSASQNFAADDLVVAGNLTVSGTTTTVNTETIKLADNTIELNSDLAGGTSPSHDGGITLNRGNQTDQSFFWDESSDAWAIGHTESSNVFTKTGYVTMAHAQTYSDSQDNVNGFGEVGHFQIDGNNVYIRTA